MSQEALLTEIEASFKQFIGRRIDDTLFADIRSAIMCKTGKPVWCDGSLNHPSISANGTVRAVFVTPNNEIASILLTGQKA